MGAGRGVQGGLGNVIGSVVMELDSRVRGGGLKQWVLEAGSLRPRRGQQLPSEAVPGLLALSGGFAGHSGCPLICRHITQISASGFT